MSAIFSAGFADQWTARAQTGVLPFGFRIPGRWATDEPSSAGANVVGSTSGGLSVNDLLSDRPTLTTPGQDNFEARFSTSPVNSALTQYIRFNEFGFDIPAGATIEGVEVLIYHANNLFGGSLELEACRLTLSAGGATLSPGSRLPGDPLDLNFRMDVLGAPNDTFGASLTPAIVNSPEFGFVVRFRGMGNSWNVYDVGLKVYYSVASADGDARVNQLFGEALIQDDGEIEINQAFLESLIKTEGAVALDQAFIEVLRSVPASVSAGRKRRLIFLQGD